MKVVVCYKLVPDVDSIKVNGDRTIDVSGAEWAIGQYDLNAVETAARLVEANEGSSLIALTVGGAIVENTKLRKSILSRGPQEMKAVKDEAYEKADCFAIASTLAAAIRKIGDVDLVVFGEGSGDIYAQQTGSVVGALLGWNTLNAVNGVEVKDGKLEVSRATEDSNEVLEVGLPAALSVTSDICVPRLASMKDILQAGKKPFEIWAPADVGASAESKTCTESILAPEQTDRMKVVGKADDENHINAVVQQLRSFM
ncbi:MAG: putative electron transfer flavoprotein FixA [Oscillospiraceae bacterium]|nr:putative electron transfer flavoprotein FixA [Oscillospiraceae bacterium]